MFTALIRCPDTHQVQHNKTFFTPLSFNKEFKKKGNRNKSESSTSNGRDTKTDFEN